MTKCLSRGILKMVGIFQRRHRCWNQSGRRWRHIIQYAELTVYLLGQSRIKKKTGFFILKGNWKKTTEILKAFTKFNDGIASPYTWIYRSLERPTWWMPLYFGLVSTSVVQFFSFLVGGKGRCSTSFRHCWKRSEGKKKEEEEEMRGRDDDFLHDSCGSITTESDVNSDETDQSFSIHIRQSIHLFLVSF